MISNSNIELIARDVSMDVSLNARRTARPDATKTMRDLVKPNMPSSVSEASKSVTTPQMIEKASDLAAPLQPCL